MGYDFSADEIFEMAKQIEVNGAAFYRKAAAKVSGEAEQAFLNTLADMEDQHEKTFADMQADLKKEEGDLVFDPQGEAVLYLKSMADTKIFFKKEEPGNEMKEILSAAIKAEQDSIVFYLGMKELVAGAAGKQRVEDIIKEEMSHIRLLAGKFSEAK
ncbi:Rubrerythrin [Desulfocicer vacuolatum DSM 3385]|uniref:Rubrerythrin n=1 Tax=Desulfocicer vacuolatum DSM 3385 TaxID=1121400 RepID=A0A1W2DHF9_9BACT|nr:ferritin family protein [Desulfocicer vacuolatum]SMC96388.1 Rubrerythrin [Desulfocicer vacuolatum DSM 3385]